MSYVFSGLERNIDSIKSTARILLCWVDRRSQSPGFLGGPDSNAARGTPELWVTWNPQRKEIHDKPAFSRVERSSVQSGRAELAGQSDVPHKTGPGPTAGQEQRPICTTTCGRAGSSAITGAYFAGPTVRRPRVRANRVVPC